MWNQTESASKKKRMKRRSEAWQRIEAEQRFASYGPTAVGIFNASHFFVHFKWFLHQKYSHSVAVALFFKFPGKTYLVVS